MNNQIEGDQKCEPDSYEQSRVFNTVVTIVTGSARLRVGSKVAHSKMLKITSVVLNVSEQVKDPIEFVSTSV